MVKERISIMRGNNLISTQIRGYQYHDSKKKERVICVTMVFYVLMNILSKVKTEHIPLMAE